MEIRRSGSQPSGKGPGEYFTGAVRIDPLFEAPDPARIRGAASTSSRGTHSMAFPIPGTTKLARLEENIAAAARELTADDLREIESDASKITVQGDTLPRKAGAHAWPLNGRARTLLVLARRQLLYIRLCPNFQGERDVGNVYTSQLGLVGVGDFLQKPLSLIKVAHCWPPQVPITAV